MPRVLAAEGVDVDAIALSRGEIHERFHACRQPTASEEPVVARLLQLNLSGELSWRTVECSVSVHGTRRGHQADAILTQGKPHSPPIPQEVILRERFDRRRSGARASASAQRGCEARPGMNFSRAGAPELHFCLHGL